MGIWSETYGFMPSRSSAAHFPPISSTDFQSLLAQTKAQISKEQILNPAPLLVSVLSAEIKNDCHQGIFKYNLWLFTFYAQT